MLCEAAQGWDPELQEPYSGARHCFMGHSNWSSLVNPQPCPGLTQFLTNAWFAALELLSLDTDYSVKRYQLFLFYSQGVYVIVGWNRLTKEIDKASFLLPQVPPHSKLDHMQQPKVYVWIPRNLFWRALYCGSYFGMIHLGQLSGSPVFWEWNRLVGFEWKSSWPSCGNMESRLICWFQGPQERRNGMCRQRKWTTWVSFPKLGRLV